MADPIEDSAVCSVEAGGGDDGVEDGEDDGVEDGAADDEVLEDVALVVLAVVDVGLAELTGSSRVKTRSWVVEPPGPTSVSV